MPRLEEGKINWSRVLPRGIATGIVTEIVEIVANGLLASDLTATLNANRAETAFWRGGFRGCGCINTAADATLEIFQ